MNYDSNFLFGLKIVAIFLCFMLIVGSITNAVFAAIENNYDQITSDVMENIDRFGSYVVIEKVELEYPDHYEITMYDPDTYVVYRYTKCNSYEFFSEVWNTDGTLKIYHEAMSAVG